MAIELDFIFLNFRLWGTIKNDVYAQEIRDKADLIEKIKAAFRRYETDFHVLQKVMNEMTRRLVEIHLRDGGKVEVCRKKNCKCQQQQ